jgi:hypothetical protein
MIGAGGVGAADVGVGVSYMHDTNTSRSVQGEHLSDDILALRVFERQAVSGGPNGVRGKVGAGLSGQRNYSDLSYIALSAALDWRVVEWSGQAGFLDVYASAELRQYAASDLRDGLLASVGGRVGQGFSATTSGSLEIGIDRRTAWTGDVFDLSNRRLQADFEARLSDAVTGYLGAVVSSGQDVFTVVTATAGGRGQGVGRSATDPAFGGGGNTYTAFRSDAVGRALDAGVRVSTGNDGEVDLRISRYSADGDAGLGYEGTTVRVGYVQRFR